ncbi:Fimbrial subunit type 1 precursor [Raoultella planticola]|uniref:Fimbrial subunit type 1 n=1 Tax=Raoultella planticola TaxID=575 RepID=A0A485BTQ7_RAOPL|nr:Fimbrial subunit type 1 precursor [Raoultella planticola]
MKIKTLAIVVLSALSLSSAAALADTTTVNGGTVHFKGEVVNAACAVDAGSIDQTVQLGQVRSAKLATAGSTSSAVGFNIQLDDCDTTVATKASVAFSGTAVDSTNTTRSGTAELCGRWRDERRRTDPRQHRDSAGAGWCNLRCSNHAERRHQHHSFPGSLLRDWRGNSRYR